MSAIFWAAFLLLMYGGGAYGVWAMIDIMDTDPHDPTPADSWWLALLRPLGLPIVGIMLLCSDLADKRKSSRGG